MIDRGIRICCVIGGVTGVCALTWPGPFPVGDPRGGSGPLLHA